MKFGEVHHVDRGEGGVKFAFQILGISSFVALVAGLVYGWVARVDDERTDESPLPISIQKQRR